MELSFSSYKYLYLPYISLFFLPLLPEFLIALITETPTYKQVKFHHFANSFLVFSTCFQKTDSIVYKCQQNRGSQKKVYDVEFDRSTATNCFTQSNIYFNIPSGFTVHLLLFLTSKQQISFFQQKNTRPIPIMCVTQHVLDSIRRSVMYISLHWFSCTYNLPLMWIISKYSCHSVQRDHV